MSVGAPAVVIVRDLADAVATAETVAWAAGQLREAIAQAGLTVEIAADLATPAERRLLLAGTGSALAQRIAEAAGVALPTEPESLAIVSAQLDGRPVLMAAGSDARGLIYAILE